MNLNITENKNEWFKKWFDSPYYHLLYRNRDEKEAEKLIKNLIHYLHPPLKSKVLDAACGKGRHAIFIESFGYNVDAFDLSQNSIAIAKKYETPQLNFYINDIRKPLNINHYDYVFNLFTSFGYFDDEKDNFSAIESLSISLKKKGVLIIDFLNSTKIINELKESESKTIENITFNIKRSLKNNFIIKDIEFKDQNKTYRFQEKVKALAFSDFKNYFDGANLRIEATFGDYELNAYDEFKSDRLILIAKKY